MTGSPEKKKGNYWKKCFQTGLNFNPGLTATWLTSFDKSNMLLNACMAQSRLKTS